jgi:hypothetical protein
MIKCCGFGVWSNVNSWTPTLVSDYFTSNESIVGDGGQTGYLFGGLQSGFVAKQIQVGAQHL